MIKKLQQIGYPLFFVVMAYAAGSARFKMAGCRDDLCNLYYCSLKPGYCSWQSRACSIWARLLFFGLGAYTTLYAIQSFGWPLLATLPLAILIPAFFGILLAGPIIHLRGDYLLVATIGFNIVFVQAVQNNLVWHYRRTKRYFWSGDADDARYCLLSGIYSVLCGTCGALADLIYYSQS